MNTDPSQRHTRTRPARARLIQLARPLLTVLILAISLQGQATYASAAGASPDSPTVTPEAAAGAAPQLQLNTLGMYVPLTPTRIVDTRNGPQPLTAPLKTGQTTTFKVTGNGGVPVTSAYVVALRATAITPTQSGSVTVFASQTPRPATSSLTFNTGQTASNTVLTAVGSDGKLSLYSASDNAGAYTIDVIGYFPNMQGTVGMKYFPVPPTRLLNTLTAAGANPQPIGANSTLDVQVTGRGGIPTGLDTMTTKGVAINVTALAPKTSGQLKVWSPDTNEPNVGTLAVTSGLTAANQVTATVSATGKIRIRNVSNAPLNVIVDAVGYYAAPSGAPTTVPTGTRYRAITPVRAVNTGPGSSQPALKANLPTVFKIAGKYGIPADAKAVEVNVNVTNVTSAGHLRAGRTDLPRPETSIIAYPAKTSISNAATIAVSPSGDISVTSSTEGTYTTVDVVGYYTATEPAPNKVWAPNTVPKPQISAAPITPPSPNSHTYTLTVADYWAMANDTNGIYNANTVSETKIADAYLNRIVNDKKYSTIIFPKLVTKTGVGVETVPWLANPIVITRSDVKLLFAAGSIVQAKPGYPPTRGLINLENANQNIQIVGETGAVLRMNRDDYLPRWDYNRSNTFAAIPWAYDKNGKYLPPTKRNTKDEAAGWYPRWTSSEFRALIVLRATKHVLIRGLTLSWPAGDGITIGSYLPDKSASHAQDITIDQVRVVNAARNGISVMNVQGLTITNSNFAETHGRIQQAGIAGMGVSPFIRSYPAATGYPNNKVNSGPWSGIDFEPNLPNEPLENIVVSNTEFSDNAGGGMTFVLHTYNNTSRPVTVTVNNCTFGVSQHTYDSFDKLEKKVAYERGLIFFSGIPSATTNRVKGNITINATFRQPTTPTGPLPVLAQDNRPPGSLTMTINQRPQPYTK